MSREQLHPVYWLSPWPGSRISYSCLQGLATVASMELIEIKLSTNVFLLTLRRIFDGERVRFGSVELHRAGFTAPRYFAPRSEVVRVMSDPTHLHGDCREQPDYHSIRYRTVSFPLLVLAIARVLIEDEGRLPPVGEGS